MQEVEFRRNADRIRKTNRIGYIGLLCMIFCLGEAKREECADSFANVTRAEFEKVVDLLFAMRQRTEYKSTYDEVIAYVRREWITEQP